MSLIHTLKFITQHPLNKTQNFKAIFRFLKWQINVRINPYPIIYSFTSKSKLIVAKGMTGATGNLYCGLHEFYDMSFLLHFLRENDLFVDIGANIGSYTILASGHAKSETIAFEPVPVTYSHFSSNVALNNILLKVTSYNMAVGSKNETIKFTKNLDTTNHAATTNDNDTIDVKVCVLDEILNNRFPNLLKIDVEGFETEVINGAKKILGCENLKAIIIELNGSGKRYGYNEQLIHDTLILNNFKPYLYNPFHRELTLVASFGTYNTIYIRDYDFVIDRLRNAQKFEILNQWI